MHAKTDVTLELHIVNANTCMLVSSDDHEQWDVHGAWDRYNIWDAYVACL